MAGELIQVIQQAPRSEMTGGAEFGRAESWGPAAVQPADMTTPPIGPGPAAAKPVGDLSSAVRDSVRAAAYPTPNPGLYVSLRAAAGLPGSDAMPGLAPMPKPRPGRAVGFDGEPTPTFRPDGLVAGRAETEEIGDFDAPMFENYYWTALLDPVELADGRDPVTDARREGTVIYDVAEVDHFGRPAWQATVRPGNAYAPRCGDCSLMRDRRVDLDEFRTDADSRYFLAEYPTGYRVRLDVGTGVCVLLKALDGSNAGDGHEVVIEGVNTDLPDALFTE